MNSDTVKALGPLLLGSLGLKQNQSDLRLWFLLGFVKMLYSA